MRFTTKPGASETTMGVFPRDSAKAFAFSTVPGSVAAPLTISTSPMTGAGLKKWMPANIPGLPVQLASSVMLRAELFVAKTVPSSKGSPFASVKTSFFAPKSSITASNSRSTCPASSAMSGAVTILSMTSAAFSGVWVPFWTALSSCALILSLEPCASDMSRQGGTMNTVLPAVAATWAIPVAIVPVP